MIRYLLQRGLAALPILLGVLLITFLLFHVVGGDPALLMLGKNAKPQEVQALRAELKLDRPLFCGHWCRTELFPAQNFRASIGAWENVPGAVWRQDEQGRGAIRIAPGEELCFPALWDPSPGERLRLKFRFRGDLVIGDQERRASTWETAACKLTLGGRTLCFKAGVSGAELATFEALRYQQNALDSQFLQALRELVDVRPAVGGHGLSVSFFNFGRSLATGEPVRDILRDGLGPSVLLMSTIFVLELIISIGIALISAYWRDSWLDRVLVVVTVGAMSISYLVYILVGQYVLAYRWNWFPVWGFSSWRNLLLPVLVGVVSGLGGSVRYYRTVFLNEMFREHIRTAVAKGCGTGRILLAHVLPNALIPVVTRISVILPFLFTGSLLLESFFGIPGLGYAGINALANGDVQVLKALVIISAMLFIAANLLADVACALVDPRVRLR